MARKVDTTDIVGRDRRREERSVCDFAATIEISPEATVIPCVVKDLSEIGARLEIAEGIALPAEFDLLLPAVPGANQRFRFRVRWRDQGLVGGEFIVP